ncbi:MAG: hypothetical protein M1825_006205 [Sarcosagium campestre]|nr:MAG: hypothetical protein M1825_006205 [Sarcosagium campestre]
METIKGQNEDFSLDRILQAALFFEWHLAATNLGGEAGCHFLEHLLADALAEQVRTLLNKSGSWEVEFSATPVVPLERLFPKSLLRHDTFIPSARTGGALILGPDSYMGSKGGNAESVEPWDVFVDSQPTNPSAFTKYKTTLRSVYVDARRRVGIHSFQTPAEVILVNTSDELMEGSLTSVYFFRDGRWVTPLTGCGGQDGTTRRYLIEQDVCVEGTIRKSSVSDGEHCYLSNGVRGIVWGRVRLTPSPKDS